MQLPKGWSLSRDFEKRTGTKNMCCNFGRCSKPAEYVQSIEDKKRPEITHNSGYCQSCGVRKMKKDQERGE